MASRYWVGGTGTWDASDTTHWSAASGGAAGASAPTAADAVVFDGNSGGGTCTTSGNLSVLSLNSASLGPGSSTTALVATFLPWATSPGKPLWTSPLMESLWR
jgi:hypothetical protein